MWYIITGSIALITGFILGVISVVKVINGYGSDLERRRIIT